MSSDYSSLKVVDLKKELKTRGLSTVGNKEELVERLNTYTQNLLGNPSDIENFNETIAENDILGEDVLEGALDYEEEDDELKKDADLEFDNSAGSNALELNVEDSTTSSSSTFDSASSEVKKDDQSEPLPQRQQPKTDKKVHIIRNRSISVVSSDTEQKENESVKVANDLPASKATSEAQDKVPKSGAKIIIKPTLSLEERMKERKRKFGLLVEHEKTITRAARFGTDNSVKSMKLNESDETLKSRTERFGIVSPDAEKSKLLEALKHRAERFGTVVSPLLNKAAEAEKLEARKNRFLTNSANVASTDEKKKLRAERFNLN